MSETLEAAAAKLRERLGGEGFDGAVKFEIEGEGAIILNADGVSVGDGDADVTISAELDVFQDMFEGGLSPTAAFMTGKIKIDGDMGAAMKIAQLFA